MILGGGGCTLTILRADLFQVKGSLVKDLTTEGFRCYETSLGGAGVLWHDGGVPPALRLAAATGGGEAAERSVEMASSDALGEAMSDEKGVVGVSQGRKATTAVIGLVAAAAALGVFSAALRQQRSCRYY